MFKSCGCLIGMILGFLFAVIVSIFVACVAFEKKPSEIKKICVEHWHQWVDDGAAAAVDKAADKAYQEIRK
ncbi:MAG: hypothetical protein MJ033_03965 [Victivallaceae bacterium]|nr:hypothetical protein [Victivallaceae bacterium]